MTLYDYRIFLNDVEITNIISIDKVDYFGGSALIIEYIDNDGKYKMVSENIEKFTFKNK